MSGDEAVADRPFFPANDTLRSAIVARCYAELNRAKDSGVEYHLHRAGAFLDVLRMISPPDDGQVLLLERHYDAVAIHLNVTADLLHGV